MKKWIVAAAALAACSNAAVAQDTAAPPAAACELHVWSSDQYEVQMSGMMAGFGLLGALVDQAGRGDERTMMVDLLKTQLDGKAQFEVLGTRDLAARLGMPGARVVWHDDQLTLDQRKEFKKAPRFADSAAPCYAEFVPGVIFYQRAAMYGSNLFGGFLFRDFSKGSKPRVSSGMVKNPLEAFPAKTPEETEAARVELLDAWSKDFDEWLDKKLKS